MVVLLVFAVGFGLGQVRPASTAESQDPIPKRSLPAPSATQQVIRVPFDGGTTPKRILDAEGECRDYQGTLGAASLIDRNPDSIWRCSGSGVDEHAKFWLDDTNPVVGVRVVNGNIADPAVYPLERRVTKIRWSFPDGSYVIQGLGANNPAAQEIRFPPVTASWVELTILETTVPGDADQDHDAFAISQVEFLGTA